VSAYITFINTNTSSNQKRKHKRDSKLVFLKLNPNGTVSITNSCISAAIFTLTPDHRLRIGELYAFVSPTNASEGLSDFTFGPANPANIEGSFTAPGEVLSWSNNLFVQDQAIFGILNSGSGPVIVSFNRPLPSGYFSPVISLLMMNSAAAGMCSTLRRAFR
jgi:hypothetical protein